jgi:hypothetical protein
MGDLQMKFNNRVLTVIIIGVVTFGLIGYDIWAYFQHDESTISERIWEVSRSWPLIPFAFGVLIGHFFFNPAENSKKL